MSLFWTVKTGDAAKTDSGSEASAVTGSRAYGTERFVEISSTDGPAYADDLDCLRAFVESLKKAIAHLEGKG